jgi:transposase-like protein
MTKRKKYTKEFKLDAVSLVTEQWLQPIRGSWEFGNQCQYAASLGERSVGRRWTLLSGQQQVNAWTGRAKESQSPGLRLQMEKEPRSQNNRGVSVLDRMPPIKYTDPLVDPLVLMSPLFLRYFESNWRLSVIHLWLNFMHLRRILIHWSSVLNW